MLAFVLLGGVAMVWTTLCLVRPARRREGILLGTAGLVAGGLAALAVLVPGLLRGASLHAIPHEPVFEWFVAVYGGAALVARVRLALWRGEGGPLARSSRRDGSEETERQRTTGGHVLPFRPHGLGGPGQAESPPPAARPPEAGHRPG